MRSFSRTVAGAAASISEVSKLPAWSPAAKAAPRRSAQRFFWNSVKQTEAPAFLASSVARFSTSRLAGSWLTLTSATARNCFASETHRSRTSAVAVSGGRLTVPGKAAPSSETQNVTGGAIRAGSPRCFSLTAVRRAISIAITVSVATGRCGPWASVFPTGRSAIGRSLSAASTSVQLISGISTFSAMVREGASLLLLSSLSLLLGLLWEGGLSDRSL